MQSRVSRGPPPPAKPPHPSRILAAAAKDSAVTPFMLRVLSVLMAYANDLTCYPKQGALAQELGQRSRGPVSRALLALAAAGYLDIEARTRASRGGRGESLYRLKLPARPEPVQQELPLGPVLVAKSAAPKAPTHHAHESAPADSPGRVGAPTHLDESASKEELPKGNFPLLELRSRTRSAAARPRADAKAKRAVAAPPGATAGDRSRGSRISPLWEVDEIGRAYAIRQGLSPPEISREAERFRNYWTAAAGRQGRKCDWPATWRNWVLNSVERKEERHGRAGRQKNAGTDGHREPAADPLFEAARRAVLRWTDKER